MHQYIIFIRESAFIILVADLAPGAGVGEDGVQDGGLAEGARQGRGAAQGLHQVHKTNKQFFLDFSD